MNDLVQVYPAEATEYYPPRPDGSYPDLNGDGSTADEAALEGGAVDRKGRPLFTLEDFLEGRAPYVSVAMDTKAFAYGTVLRIPELEKKNGGRRITFLVVDTGGAFRGKGTGRIDICCRCREKGSKAPMRVGRVPVTLLAFTGTV